MRQAREKDIEAAREYLLLRLEAERSMVRNLEGLMREAAERFVDVCYAAGVDAAGCVFDKLPARVRARLEEVVEWLRETIEDYFLTLAVYDHEDSRDVVVPLILGRTHGMTLGERLEDYCRKFRDELLVLIGAGLALKVARGTLAASIGDNLRHPYGNALLRPAIAAPLSYGRGRTNSMLTALGDLTRHGIARGWMRHWELATAARGAVGWVVRRGSSVACGLCDDNCGFHAVDEGTGLPMHNSCCCVAVAVYDD